MINISSYIAHVFLTMKTRKKRTMKMILIVMMVGLQLEIAIAADRKSYVDSPSYFVNKERKEIRSKSDFRPDSLSTAPGFGKRKDPFESPIDVKYGRPQSVTLVSATYPTKRIMMHWFLQFMKRYPDITTSLITIEFSNSKKINRSMMDKLLRMRNSHSFF